MKPIKIYRSNVEEENEGIIWLVIVFISIIGGTSFYFNDGFWWVFLTMVVGVLTCLYINPDYHTHIIDSEEDNYIILEE